MEIKETRHIRREKKNKKKVSESSKTDKCGSCTPGIGEKVTVNKGTLCVMLSQLCFSIFINSLSRLLCFVDDVKVFTQIHSRNDSLETSSVKFGNRKAMTIQRDPLSCVFVSYSRLRGLKIPRCYGFVMDLGFKFSNDLDPGIHIEMVCC